MNFKPSKMTLKKLVTDWRGKRLQNSTLAAFVLMHFYISRLCSVHLLVAKCNSLTAPIGRRISAGGRSPLPHFARGDYLTLMFGALASRKCNSLTAPIGRRISARRKIANFLEAVRDNDYGAGGRSPLPHLVRVRLTALFSAICILYLILGTHENTNNRQSWPNFRKL